MPKTYEEIVYICPTCGDEQAFRTSATLKEGVGSYSSKDAITSRLAAQLLRGKLPKDHLKILEHLEGVGSIGATDAELEEVTGMMMNSVSPRRNELCRYIIPPLVENTGRRRQGRTEHSTNMIWVITEPGRQALTQIREMVMENAK